MGGRPLQTLARKRKEDERMKDEKLNFREIHDVFRPKILRYLTRLAGEPDAEGLTQEVFVRVSQSLDSFRGESQLPTWIYRIATNAAIDRLRSRPFQGMTQEMPTIEQEGSKEGTFIQLRGNVSPVDQLLIRKEMNRCIRNLINKLPEDYRIVVVLSELEELGNREIAEILQVSVGAVKIRLHRARARLKKELEDHCSFYRDERNVLSCDLKSAIRNVKESG